MPRYFIRLLFALAVSSVVLATVFRAADPPAFTPAAKASDEAHKALQRFRMPAGLEAKVWAAEPMLAHPVSFAFDEKGRCFVAETFRLHQGVSDNRNHMNWLDDDIACRTVDDRVAMYRKYAKEKFASTYEAHSERVKLLEDTTGTGVADKATVFAEDFGHAADGIGAGLLARQGSVYYTCIPDLWRLKDGRRESLAHGFGVHVAFLGHDLHGLRMGPDGRIYFSSGDRGLNVTTKEGKHLFLPDCGGVLRCEPDGSNLEIVATGLRNPQELAFDEFGNLFTVDNNSDSGDQARLVYIVEGGDSGWRMSYQYGTSMGNRGPFNAEKIWHLPPAEQPAYIVPPLAHLTSGPSGLCYNPGCVSLPEKYANHFFVCDFRGSSGGSGVWAFEIRPKGASFELAHKEEFIWSILATDCDFGPDGGFYISDWTEGWNLTGKGRIYRFADPAAARRPEVAEVKKLLAEGFEQRSIEELVKLLNHHDQRVRQEAQFALADKGVPAIAALTPLARLQAQTATERMARFHALWVLGQLARRNHEAALPPILAAAGDHDSEARAQAAALLGDLNGLTGVASLEPLTNLCGDSEPRVRFFAALSLGKVAAKLDAAVQGRAGAELRKLTADIGDSDLYLRAACAIALARLNSAEAVKGASDTSPAIRLVTLLALRRQNSTAVAGFLSDADPRIVLEAARAINDLPIPEALPQLAAMIARPGLHEHLLYRTLNANFRLGKPENAAAMAAFAARADAPEKLRVEAVRMLGDWANPSNRDRITGLWQPLEPRDEKIGADALRARLGGIFAGSDALRKETTKVAAKLGITEVAATLRSMARDTRRSAESRVAAIRALDVLKDPQLQSIVELAIDAKEPSVEVAGWQIYIRLDPDRAIRHLIKEVIVDPDEKSLPLKQGAIEILGHLPEREDVDATLDDLLGELIAKKLPAELQLEVVEATKLRVKAGVVTLPRLTDRFQEFEKSSSAKDHLATWRETLAGGDAAKGREIFLNKSEVSCVRCHKLNGIGGDVGPELAGIGGKQTREYLLESIVLPDKQIAKGFDTLVLELTNGKTVTGVLKSEDEKEVKLITAEGQPIVVAKAQIEERRRGKSAMPEDLVQKLTKRELRDLVEFLAGLK